MSGLGLGIRDNAGARAQGLGARQGGHKASGSDGPTTCGFGTHRGPMRRPLFAGFRRLSWRLVGPGYWTVIVRRFMLKGEVLGIWGLRAGALMMHAADCGFDTATREKWAGGRAAPSAWSAHPDDAAGQ